MPLTNVWTYGKNGEWVRTTATQADRHNDYSISANDWHFRCYNCFQFVSFVKGSYYQSSHFKHIRGYDDKDCEDRSVNSGYSHPYIGVENMAMPVRIAIDGARLSLYIGLQPISPDELKRCISQNLQISIAQKYGEPIVYRLDESRITPHTTTWLPISTSSLVKPRIEFTPMNAKPSVWSGVVPEIPSSGTVFDSQNGRRIPDKGDIVINHNYYVLRRHGEYLCSGTSDVTVTRLAIDDRSCSVYQVRALRFSKQASDFFFKKLRLRLTNYPVEMSVLWPPMLKKDDILETNFRRFQLIVKGEADFSSYPMYYSSHTSTVFQNNIKLYDVRSSGILQMVTSERYSRTLSFMYIRPLESEFDYSAPHAEICYDDGQACSGTILEDIPPRGILHITLTDDGYVDVFDGESFYYRKHITAREKTRITDLKRNMRISVFVGLEQISTIEITPKQIEKALLAITTIPPWKGKMVPFPKRYAWILDHIDTASELYERILFALRQGKIPKDGLQALQKVTEELEHALR